MLQSKFYSSSVLLGVAFTVPAAWAEEQLSHKIRNVAYQVHYTTLKTLINLP